MRAYSGIAICVLVLALSVPPASGALAADAGVESGGDGARSSPASCDFPYETTDALGATVRLPAEPQRVVTLAPSAAQTMWEIGQQEKVVGLTKYAGYLEGAEERANVSGSSDIVIVEQVVALEPDLVLAPNVTSTETVEQLRDAGVTVYHFPAARGIEDVYRKTRTIGRLSGSCEGAEETIGEVQSRMGAVREAVDGRPQPDVLYAFFGYTAGRGTFIHELIEAAGANNVAADYNVTGYRQLSPEVVVESDPDWIVRNSENPIGVDSEVLNQTTAGREDHIVVVQIEHINQPAPRFVRAIETLAERFHPQAYTGVNATERNVGTTTPTPTSTTSSPTATETAGQPGFGLHAALVGLAVAVIAIRVRG